MTINNDYMLGPGDMLYGQQQGRGYQVERSLSDEGMRGTTVVASLLEDEAQKVVIKVPRLDLSRRVNEIRHRLSEVQADIEREITAYNRLRKSKKLTPYIADILDFGVFDREIKRRAMLIPFVVQELVRGQELETWCTSTYGEPFTGIIDVADWFSLVRHITNIIALVHQERVVHGDFWPPNIIMKEGKEPQPVIIDFGQAWLLDIDFNKPGEDKHRYAYYAPERWITEGRSWYAPADIYSLGGVMYYLATGQEPLSPYEGGSTRFGQTGQRKLKTKDDLKREVVNQLLHYNPQLYHRNVGIADIILYCMRPSTDGRASHAELVREALDLFEYGFKNNPKIDSGDGFSNVMPGRIITEIDQKIEDLHSETNHLFYRLVGRDIHSLKTQLRDVNSGLYSVTGNRNTILSYLLTSLSYLKSGDQCLALTTPLFWAKHNFGTDGRMLSMLKMAALNGVNIRWVLIFTAEEWKDPDVQLIIEAHRAAVLEAEKIARSAFNRKIAITNRDIEDSGYFVGYRIVSDDERKELVRRAGTFVVFNQRDGEQDNITLVAPTYTQSGGQITVVRFWKDPWRWEDDLKVELMDNLRDCETITQTMTRHESG